MSKIHLPSFDRAVSLKALIASIVTALIVGLIAGAFVLPPLFADDRCERAWSENSTPGKMGDVYEYGTVKGTAYRVVEDIFEVDTASVANLSGKIVAAEERSGKSLGVFDAMEVCLSHDLKTASSVRVLD